MKTLAGRDLKRRKLYKKYQLLRLQYKSHLTDSRLSKETRGLVSCLLNTLPRNSSKVRIGNRCILTGRGSSVLNDFKLSRIQFRELALQGLIAGVTKSSW